VLSQQPRQDPSLSHLQNRVSAFHQVSSFASFQRMTIPDEILSSSLARILAESQHEFKMSLRKEVQDTSNKPAGSL
jgi:hypothetical protein